MNDPAKASNQLLAATLFRLAAPNDAAGERDTSPIGGWEQKVLKEAARRLIQEQERRSASLPLNHSAERLKE